MSRMYLSTDTNGKASKKAGDIIMFVESARFRSTKSFAAGVYTSDVSLRNLSLWYETPTFESEVNSQKTGEHFVAHVTFEDQGK